ncbi:MAG: hypothetical protein MJZ34_13370 [Paludibacteraceae bacterium]|nr:hypothetical protein [Paludibacteraceae bacterium]
MAKITKQISVDVQVNGKDLADLFWDMDSDEQAAFYYRLLEIRESMPYNFIMQLESIRQDLTKYDSSFAINGFNKLFDDFNSYLSKDGLEEVRQ